jgi:hypothetical protein
MSIWIGLILDVVLIGLVTAGLVQAARLIRQLAGLRQNRLEMERFVQEFNATVTRAETGIKGLRHAARESGDDLETLVEKAVMIRDELQFITESADQIANRLSQSAASAVQRPEKTAAARTDAQKETDITSGETVKPLASKKPSAASASRAEQELMQVLEKLG